jgi:hypothetical protein
MRSGKHGGMRFELLLTEEYRRFGPRVDLVRDVGGNVHQAR